MVTFLVTVIELCHGFPGGHYWRTVPIHFGPEVDRFINAAAKSSLETSEGWLNRDYIVHATPNMKFDEISTLNRPTQNQDSIRQREQLF